MLRQDGVFDRPEQCRLQPQQEQRRQQHGEAMQIEAERRYADDHDFQQFDEARQPGLIVFVGQLPGGGGKKEERQNEQASR